MTPLEEFFERLDHIADEIDGGVDPADLVDDEAIARRGARMLPMFRQRAERAGVDIDDLLTILHDRSAPTATAVAHRLEDKLAVALPPDAERELVDLAVAAGMQFFLAGVIWQQDRELPTMEA